MSVAPVSLDDVLREVPETVLARWYVDLNRWHWPQGCLLPAPEGFDTLPQTEQQALMRPLWAYIHQHTTAQARSRAWWLVALHRSEADWATYWALPVCPQCALRHAAGVCAHRTSAVRLVNGLIVRHAASLRTLVRQFLRRLSGKGA